MNQEIINLADRFLHAQTKEDLKLAIFVTSNSIPEDTNISFLSDAEVDALAQEELSVVSMKYYAQLLDLADSTTDDEEQGTDEE